MATTIINPPANGNSDNHNNGMGFMIGAVVLLLFGFLFFVYGLPYLRTLSSNGGIQINVPKSVDVNVKQSK